MIAIIGAGISGLSLAYHLQKQGKPYILLESNSVTGGYMQTDTWQNKVMERGPNSILADEFVLDFIQELGLTDQLVKANKISKQRYVFKDGKYRNLPSGPLSLLLSSFFSIPQRIAVFKEFYSPLPYREDISLYDLITERFGKEVADYALDPFVSGVYAGDAKELLADLCFPVLGKNITNYGSILKGFIKNPPMRRQSITFKEGLGTLISTLAKNVQNIHYNCTVENIKQVDGNWELSIKKDTTEQSITCNRVVLAIPAYQAAKIIRSYSPEWSSYMEAIEYPMVRTMHLIYKKSQLGFQPEGFGALHPRVEPLFTAGVIWNSSTFNGRTDEDEVLLTCMVTEKRTPHIRSLSEAEVKESILKEIQSLYKIEGKPLYVKSGVWEKAIPQYTNKMTTILNHCEELEKMNVYICSNWPYGISITDCIHRAHDLASKF